MKYLEYLNIHRLVGSDSIGGNDDDECKINRQNHQLLLKTYFIILTVATIATFYYARQESYLQHGISSHPIPMTKLESFRLLLELTNNASAANSQFNDDMQLISDQSNDISLKVNVDESTKVSADHNVSKPTLFPLRLSDYIGLIFAILGLMLSAGGGIGGGGILVPIYILVMGFAPRYAIPLSNVTVVGGAIANNLINIPERHPLVDRPLIDFDLVLAMTPLTLLGALIGAFLNKVLPELLITILLALLLSATSYTSLKKAVSMYKEESDDMIRTRTDNAIKHDELLPLTLSAKGNDAKSNQLKQPVSLHTEECSDDGFDSSFDDEIIQNHPKLEVCNQEIHYGSTAPSPTQTGHALEKILKDERNIPIEQVLVLVFLFVVVLTANLLKGGGSSHPSLIGIRCGSISFWMVHGFLFIFILSVAIYFRHYLIQRYIQKQQCNYQYVQGDIQWNEQATIYIPLICCFAGFFAGMFGIGGGIITGPLILAMGVRPEVNSATTAFMILLTSLTATTSYIVFGLILPDYAVACLLIGFGATYIGHVILYYYIRKWNRNSFIAFSIGLVVLLSSILMTMQTTLSLLKGDTGHAHGICS